MDKYGPYYSLVISAVTLPLTYLFLGPVSYLHVRPASFI